MPDYELTRLAEEDMKGIARYTIDTWGIEQAKRYEALLSDRFQEIAQGVITPRIFLKRRPDLLFTHCEHHYIFYWQPKNGTKPIILAVLHERMNLVQRLKNRLVTST
ncbi:MAG: type II toxin-antitoxin system RelE/ParE family toxin [Nitrosomonas sp.]|nr:type II toxin-antitoxin system RelE/ParE family toxin [Nitrosomonas sp.]